MILLGDMRAAAAHVAYSCKHFAVLGYEPA
jgi:hypothetical protein